MNQTEVLQKLESVRLAPAMVMQDGKTYDTGHLAVVGKSGKCYGVHSHKYKLLSHADAFSRTFEALDREGIEYKPTRLELPKGGSRAFMHLRFPDEIVMSKADVKKGDILNLELIICNSYDGMIAFQMELGALRLVCTNGMTISEKVLRVRQEHAAGFLKEDVLVDEFMAQLEQFQNSVLPILKSFRDLKLTVKEGLALIEALVIAEKYKKEIADRWMLEEMQNGWGLYNVITHIASHAIQSYMVQRKLQAQAFQAVRHALTR